MSSQRGKLCSSCGKLSVEYVEFKCPGCLCVHWVPVHGDGVTWQWNGEADTITLSPSLLINKHDPANRCHLFVQGGKLAFLSDSHHALAGKTVDMVPIADEEF